MDYIDNVSSNFIGVRLLSHKSFYVFSIDIRHTYNVIKQH